MISKEKWHYTAPYILAPQHPVTINLIGAGGNGSQVITQLARINHALKNLGHPGIHVNCFDDDIVTDANMARQLFSPAEIGLNKAVAIVTRINQFFGTTWQASPFLYAENTNAEMGLRGMFANITISCVDSVKARKMIIRVLESKTLSRRTPYDTGYYWMDLGNSQSVGQFVIGTLQKIKQPKNSETLQAISVLPGFFKKFPEAVKQKEKDSGPSCSLADALKKQDLFINSALVQVAMSTLWKMFREGKVDYHGAYLNLQSMDIAKINL